MGQTKILDMACLDRQREREREKVKERERERERESSCRHVICKKEE
jgi:hypothetical protein